MPLSILSRRLIGTASVGRRLPLVVHGLEDDEARQDELVDGAEDDRYQDAMMDMKTRL